METDKISDESNTNSQVGNELKSEPFLGISQTFLLFLGFFFLKLVGDYFCETVSEMCLVFGNVCKRKRPRERERDDGKQ